MPIKNYTTRIAAEKTIGQIQTLLRRWKVREASMRWDDDGTPIALWFTLETKWGAQSYSLPANVDGVWKVLKRTVSARTDRQQAARVAWRTIQDWLEAQLALIEAGAVDFEQVMLPYQEVNESGTTVYELWVSQRAALPAPDPA